MIRQRNHDFSAKNTELRLHCLRKAIDNNFGKQKIDEVMAMDSPENSLFDMYTVLVKSGSLLRLVHCYNDTTILAVLGKPSILDHVQFGDTFLFYLLQDGAYWNIVYMSQPYESVDVSEPSSKNRKSKGLKTLLKGPLGASV